MDLTLGVMQYSDTRAHERPDIAVGALSALAKQPGEPISFQGQFAGTDRWSRRAKVSSRSLDQLTTDLQGQVYSHVLVYRGARNAESAVLSFDCGSDSREGEYPVNISYVTHIHDEAALARGVAMSVSLWFAFSPAYGLSVVGEDWRDVNAELTAIPYTMWGDAIDRADEDRLLELQGLRSRFGSYCRPAAWGNFLGAHLVEALGGSEEVRRRAPVACVQSLAGGGLYLQATSAPLLIKTEGYQSALFELNHFLRPVLVPTLRGA